jgi:hypothetical protein
MTDFRVGMTEELTAEHVEALRGSSITLDKDAGPTTFAGANDLGPIVTYLRLAAEDEADAKAKVGKALGVEPHNLVAARVV